MSSIVEQIRAKIAAAQIIEAGTLLKIHGDKLSSEQKQRLKTDIHRKQDEAERLVIRAKKAEEQGLVAESIALLEKAAFIAADLPQLRQKMDKLGEAAILTRAVKNKAMRREQVVRVRPSSSPVKRTALLAVVIILLLVAVYMAGKFSSPQNRVTQLNTSSEAEVSPQSENEASLVSEKQIASEDLITPVPQQDAIPLPPVEIEAAPSSDEINKPEPVIDTAPSQPPDQIQFVVPDDGTKVNALLPEMSDIMTIGKSAAKPQEQQVPPLTSSTAQTAKTQRLAKTYIIQPGDSLSTIAYRLFCNEKERVKLYEINKDILESPRNLKPGTTIRIYSPVISIDNQCTE